MYQILFFFVNGESTPRPSFKLDVENGIYLQGLNSLYKITGKPMESSDIGITRETYMSQFCLCWRCTRAGTSSDPDVVLLRWAFWVQGDLILIYYWGRLRLAAPMGGDPCSAVL